MLHGGGFSHHSPASTRAATQSAPSTAIPMIRVRADSMTTLVVLGISPIFASLEYLAIGMD